MSTADDKPAVTPATEAPPQDTPESSVAAAQVDGSGPPGNGSAYTEKEFKVEVKLADRQANPNDPLYSAKSFEELNL